MLEGTLNSIFFANIAFAGVALNLFLLLALLLVNARKIVGMFSKIEKKWWAALAAILILTIATRMLFPIIDTAYTDDLWNIELGRNILEKGSAVTCEYAGFQQKCTPYMKPMGIQLIYTTAFLFFGANAGTVLYTNILFGTLTPILIFLIAFLLFKNEKTALYSALFFTLFPGAIKISKYLDNDAPAIFFILLTILSLLILSKKKDPSTQTLSILALTFAIQTKSTGLLLIPLAAHTLYKNHKKIKIWPLAILLLFTAPILIQYHNYWHLNQEIALKMRGSLSFSEEYLLGNLKRVPDILFNWLPLGLIPLVIIAVLDYLKKKNPAILFSIFFFFLFFTPPLFFFLFDRRYVIVAFIGLFFLGGSGLGVVEEKIKHYFKNENYSTIAVLILLMLLICSFLPLIETEINNVKRIQKNQNRIIFTHQLNKIERDFPSKCYMVTKEPSLFANSRIRAISESYLIANPSFVEEAKEKGACLLYYSEIVLYGPWAGENNKIKKLFEMRKFRDYHEKNQKFTIYKIISAIPQ